VVWFHQRWKTKQYQNKYTDILRFKNTYLSENELMAVNQPKRQNNTVCFSDVFPYLCAKDFLEAYLSFSIIWEPKNRLITLHI